MPVAHITPPAALLSILPEEEQVRANLLAETLRKHEARRSPGEPLLSILPDQEQVRANLLRKALRERESRRVEPRIPAPYTFTPASLVCDLSRVPTRDQGTQTDLDLTEGIRALVETLAVT